MGHLTVKKYNCWHGRYLIQIIILTVLPFVSFVVIIVCLLMSKLGTTNNQIFDLMLCLNNTYSMMVTNYAMCVILDRNLKLDDTHSLTY